MTDQFAWAPAVIYYGGGHNTSVSQGSRWVLSAAGTDATRELGISNGSFLAHPQELLPQGRHDGAQALHGQRRRSLSSEGVSQRSGRHDLSVVAPCSPAQQVYHKLLKETRNDQRTETTLREKWYGDGGVVT